jgi:TonB family protein
VKDDPGRSRPDPRSPVQPGGSNAWYFVVALFAAVVIWTIQQLHIQDYIASPEQLQLQPKPSSSARGDLRTLFSSDDYPTSAMVRDEQGTVRAELGIDTHGRVEKCSIVQSSGHASLDGATCRILLRRARFTPARDLDGKPVPDSVTTPAIVWRLEG